MNTMSYKCYEAVVEYDEDAEIFHGEVMNTRDIITFQGPIGRRAQGRSDGIGRGLSRLLPRPRGETGEADRFVLGGRERGAIDNR